MSSESLDYTPLLPGKLQDALTDATKTWKLTSDAQDAVLFPLFVGIPGFQPDVLTVRKNFNDLGTVPVTLCQDITSYSQFFTTIVNAIKDRAKLATTLKVVVGRWHQLDPAALRPPQNEITHILTYDAKQIKSIEDKIKDLSAKIAAWTSASTDPLFEQDLFTATTPLFGFLAQFPATADGYARFADATNTSVQVVKTPLKQAFHKPLIGNPLTIPDVVAKSLTDLVSKIAAYFSNIDKVVAGIDTIVRDLSTVASAAAHVPQGVSDFAASVTGTKPVDAATAEVAWAHAGDASKGFVDAIVGKPSGGLSVSATAPTTIRALAAKSDPSPPLTPSDVYTAFSPPTYAAYSLTALGKQILDAATQINTVTTLPWNSDFKVKVDGADISLYAAMVQTKTSFEAVKANTIPVVSDIKSYSLVNKTILPMLNKKDLPIAPADLLKTWAMLVKSYTARANQSVTDGQALLKAFRTNVGTLKNNLVEVRAKIAAEKKALEEAQAAYDALKAEMIIQGILAVIFTVGAIAAAYSGEGELVKELGQKAGESLKTVMDDDIKAGEIMILIKKLERIIAIVENTQKQLEIVIGQVTTVVSSMTDIVKVWTDVATSLTFAQKNVDALTTGSLLQDNDLTVLANRWATLEKASVAYVDSILGIPTPSSVNTLAVSTSRVSAKALQTTDFTASDVGAKDAALKSFISFAADPNVHRLMAAPSTTADRIEQFKLINNATMDNAFYNAIKAPSLKIGVNRQSMNNSASAYNQAANIMQPIFPNDAGSLRDLANRIGKTVIPSVSDCIAFYQSYSNRQISTLGTHVTKASLQSLANDNAQFAKQGLAKAQSAQRVVLDFKNQSNLVNNQMIQRGNEIQQRLDQARRDLQDKKNELAKYDWIKWMPGIGAIIKLIVEAITHTEDQIRDLSNQANQLTALKMQVAAARQIEDSSYNTVLSLTSSWVTITQEAVDLQGYLQVIADVPETADALADTAKQTWTQLNKDLAVW